MGAHVNLISHQPVDGSPYSATDAENVRRFQAKLTSLGVNATSAAGWAARSALPAASCAGRK